MFSEGKLEELLRNVYYGGIDGAGYAEESVKGMLNMIDFHALTQAIRHEAQPVYAFALQGYLDGTFQRHGDRELFGQRATLLYEVPLDDEDWMHTGRLPHIRELWMLESGQLVTVSCARLELTVLSAECMFCKRRDVDCGGIAWGRLEQREDVKYPWLDGVPLELEDLTMNLRQMCLPVYEGRIPREKAPEAQK